MLQRFASQHQAQPGDRGHRPERARRLALPESSCRALGGALMMVLVSLLAPPTVSAQDRSAVRATATVLPAGPSQAALRSALRLAHGRLPGDSVEAAHPQLARLRVRRPGPRDEATVVVSIEFLRN